MRTFLFLLPEPPGIIALKKVLQGPFLLLLPFGANADEGEKEEWKALTEGERSVARPRVL